MQKKIKKTLRKRLAAVSVAAASTLALVSAEANAVSCLGQSTFDDGIGLPWHTCSALPAEQKFDISDGTYNVTIVNPGGKERGGDSRWDLAFKHKNLYIKEGHTYNLHWELESSYDGEISVMICSADGNKIVWQNNAPDWNLGWENTEIKKGKNSFDCEFTADKTIEDAEWRFQYGGAGEYQKNDCFPKGTQLKFDNLTLECKDCGGEYISKDKTPCLWTAQNHWNSSDIFGKIEPWSDVRLNQVGYYPNSSKIATYATAEPKAPVSFKVLDKSGKAVYNGTGVYVKGSETDNKDSKGYYKESGEYCQLLDFSKVKTPGSYTIEVDDPENTYTDKYTGKVYKKYISHEFKISDDLYKNVLTDAMNYFYQNRSGIDINEQYISSSNPSDSSGKAKLAHKANNVNDTAYVQQSWQKTYGKTFDGNKTDAIIVSGGWYDADTFCKSVVGGANAVWLLQNMYEREKINKEDGKWNDSKTIDLPENGGSGAGVPDVLDEARYELEFMFKMIVDPKKDSFWGTDYENFVYHEVCDSKNQGVGVKRFDYIDDYNGIVRIVRPPTYAATFNMIACAAQAARLWEEYDPDFAKECLDNAKKSWNAVMKYREYWDSENDDAFNRKWALFAPLTQLVLSDIRGDENVRDEAYWAACELFVTTGDDSYYDFLKDYENKDSDGHNKAFDITSYLGNVDTEASRGSFNNVNTSAMGTLSLFLSDKLSADDKKLISENISNAAKKYLELENSDDNAMGTPYKSADFKQYISVPHDEYVQTGYEYQSNGRITNNALIMAYAYDITKDSKYLNGVSKAMDYIFGRNGLGISYVTGYGEHYINNPRHTFWANEIDRDFPMSPSGVMASGAASGLRDDYVKSLGMSIGKTFAQKCYADSVEAWFENTPSLEMQAALAWDISFLDNESVIGDIPTTTTTSVTSTTTTTTTVTTSVTTTSGDISLPEPDLKGDANCDKNVDMADVVLIMQSMANPNKYGLGGTDKNAVTKQGIANADVDKTVVGLTGNDALIIQEYLLGKIKEL
ncbi:MAG: glycoside hydrolase family 9 protein [Ruminococcus sp.]|uniref:glycoside hydrolase family 9 protein n=1 Tax=Ruminococcus sp. TaxID=41978 RepID=UPI0025F6E78B|nr:glycoside hydrolase family 9 protein [Ruminococcus sp.]MCR5600335.1 glycoside hydrolase family 9 protein [Ruminococcus sp.]